MKRLIPTFLMIILVISLQAQTDFSYRLRYLTTEEGLSQNTVDDILCDSKGFMWFATWNGLCRYDGYSFQVFKAEGKDSGLPGNFVQRVCEGPGGKIWIGTSQGLGIYNLAEARFESVEWAGSQLANANVSAFAVDGDHRIWVGTVDQGLFLLEKKLKETGYTVRHFALNNNPIYSLLPDKRGGCLVGTRLGLREVVTQEGELIVSTRVQLPGLVPHEILSLWQDKDGPLWVGTDFGLYLFKSPGALPQAFLHDPDNSSSLLHNAVTAITRDKQGNLLIGTLGGLCTYMGGQVFNHLEGTIAAKNQLNNAFVNSLYCDQSGNVWIGTEKGGVNTYNLFQKKFKQLTHEDGNPKSLTHKTVNSLLAEEKYLWVGTAGGGLNRITRENGTIASSVHNPHLTGSISSDFITAIHRDQLGDLWLATWGGGINRMEGDNMKVFQRFQSPNSGLVNNFVSSLSEDENGHLLVGTASGLMIFNPADQGFKSIPLGKGTSDESQKIGCILHDREGFFWIGTRQGLFRFQASELGFGQEEKPIKSLEFFQAGNQQLSLPGDYIISLYQDKTGTIWAGTFGNGLVRVRLNQGKVVGFDSFTHEQGLCNNTVYSIQEGTEGELWLTTDHGLARFDPSNQSFRSYFKSDGLADNQFYWSASCQDQAGNLYFGGVNGLSYFSPKEIQPYPYAPRVVFSDFRVSSHSLEVGESRYGRVALNKDISQAKEAHLSYKDNIFSIEFTAQHYHLPERLTYYYQMEGVDQNWVEVASDRHFASYTNLAGGTYHFQVKAVNEDGLPSGQVASLTVVIAPPFWKTNWFIGMLVLLTILGVMAYIRLRTHYLHLQKRKLEHEVVRRTRKIEEQKAELEEQKLNLIELNEKVKMVNQLRLRFFTNVSHEFRTPLTLIIDPIESLMEEYPVDSSTGKTLRIIYRNGQRLLHLINQLMNFRRVEAGKLRVRAGEGDMSGFVREVFASFAELARQQKIRYELTIQGNPGEATWFDPEKLENVLYNLLANAFKYTPKEGNIALQMTYLSPSDSGAVVEIQVKDTGIGISPDQQARIFDHFYQVESTENRHLHGSGVGLALVKELVGSMHGEIGVESAIGKGSTFQVLLPYSEEAFSKNERENEPVSYHSNLTTQVALTREELALEDQRLPQKYESGNREKPILLVVEDNHDLRAFLTQSLAPLYRILESDNGKEALELARKYTPHLIISDIMMPVMDGMELCSHLKGNIQTSHIPVILLTARNQVEQWVDGLEAGADDYIPKPFNLKILLARIENLIASRQRLKLLFTKEERPHTEEVTANPLDQQFLQRVYDLMDAQNNDAEFSHDQLAEALCMSRSLLYKKIKALTGMTVTEFSNSHRLRLASRLLNNSEVPISEIAYRCGFNDPKYFSRIFRKYYGMSPSEYAQQNLVSAEIIGGGN